MQEKQLDFIIVDLICVELAFFIAYHLRIGQFTDNLRFDYSYMNVLVVLVHLVVVFWMECYRDIMHRGYLEELKQVSFQNVIVLAILLVLFFFTKQSTTYSRIMISVFFGVDILLMYAGRTICKRVLLSRKDVQANRSRILVLSVYKHAESVIHGFGQEYTASGDYELTGVVILDRDMQGQTVAGLPVVSDREHMLEYVRNNVVDEVYIRCGFAKASELADAFLTMGLQVHIGLDRYAAELPNPVYERFGENAVLTSSINAMSLKQRVLKRAFDIVVSVIGLVLTAGLTVVLAPIIYIQSPGPVFFVQNRVGKNGRVFKMYKFRSMYMDAEERKKELLEQNQMQGFMFKLDKDPRVTPIGRFIRRTSLDEFPQFWNVLKGDLSLVGTRPPTVDEVEQYELHHLSRLAMKPGITGLWQVSGRSDITDFEEVVRLDNQYIRNFSLSLDAKILVKTVGVVLGMKGSK
jgi:exopolysaccharide biosynthesis polyprenyl glycosylphosphotransferase